MNCIEKALCIFLWRFRQQALTNACKGFSVLCCVESTVRFKGSNRWLIAVSVLKASNARRLAKEYLLDMPSLFEEKNLLCVLHELNCLVKCHNCCFVGP